MAGGLITRQEDFNEICEQIRAAGIGGFDTEFVAESFYRPKLCLLQLAWPGETACVDPFQVQDLSRWWDLMTDDQTTIVVHGGREEIRFCHFATGRPPRKLVDVQIAEGLRSRGYPLSYGNLVGRVLGKPVSGKATRTDWMRRPLTKEQVDYAQEDVKYLLDIWDRQARGLQKGGRYDWAMSEFERFVAQVAVDDDGQAWKKLPGVGRLGRREMAVARALFDWREKEAEVTDKPARRVFRDDLIIEMAKRQPTTVRDLNMTRGLIRRDYQRVAEAMIDVINEARSQPESAWPEKPAQRMYPPQDEVLARLLALALANRCHEMGLSMSLVGTMADLNEVVHWHVFDQHQGPVPRLLSGWRAEVCGTLLTDVLDGKILLRVTNPKAEDPVSFEVTPHVSG
jgi:ribonuclease D